MGVNAIMNENYYLQIRDVALIWMVFLTPNLAYLIFYWITHIGIVLISALVKGTHDLDQLTADFDMTVYTWMFGVLILFWLLHVRELKRFFEQ